MGRQGGRVAGWAGRYGRSTGQVLGTVAVPRARTLMIDRIYSVLAPQHIGHRYRKYSVLRQSVLTVL